MCKYFYSFRWTLNWNHLYCFFFKNRALKSFKCGFDWGGCCKAFTPLDGVWKLSLFKRKFKKGRSVLLKLFTIKYILQVLLQNCWGQLSKLEYIYIASKDCVTSAIFRYSCSPSSFSMQLPDHLLLFTEIRGLLFPLRKYYHYPLNAFFSYVPPDPPLTSTYVEVFEIKIIFVILMTITHF